MLYSPGHGRETFTSSASPLAFAAAATRTFRFYDPSAPQVKASTKVVNDLVALGQAMTDSANFPDKKDSSIPAAYTYFGQFIDHDLSAGTDSDVQIRDMNKMMAGKNKFDPTTIKPVDRDQIEAGVLNQNTGMFDLDSVYGDVIIESDFDKAFAATLRAKGSQFPGKMQIAFPDPDPDGPITPPKDGASDLLRLGTRLGNGLDPDDIVALPENVRNLFLKSSDIVTPDFNLIRALIGDARNDENLFVAQVHLAWLRLHNRIVDACDDAEIRNGGSDALFEYAKARTRWTYQWVIANDFLPTVCDAATLKDIHGTDANLYGQFLTSTGGADPKRLPLPLEFSVAAFRFAHSMVREEYDWNKNFTPVSGTAASISTLFRFTGSVGAPFFPGPQLPSNWPIDFARLAVPHPKGTLRTTRAIDTNLSIDLGQLPDGHHDKPMSLPDPRKNLAVRNLLKGYQLNLPSAQSVAQFVTNATGLPVPMMSADEIVPANLEEAFAGTGFREETPLWYYILREAELLGQGETLGPLGTHIVASTMLGLIKADPNSYRNTLGSDAKGQWQPSDMPKPSGVEIGSFADVLRAALVLE